MLLFVYGTLKTGHVNNFLLRKGKLVGPCTTHKLFRLYDCGPFPALVKEEYHLIEGELWEVDEAIMEGCDRLEGHPNLYKREEIEVDIQEKILTAWTYFFNRKINSALKPMVGPRWPEDKPPTLKQVCEHHAHHGKS